MTRFVVSFLLLGTVVLAAPAEARRYGMFPAACTRPPEGRIETGDGWLTLTETRFTRVGEKTDLPDGWFEARYSAISEGVEEPPVTLKLRITPQEIEVRHEDGRAFKGVVCP